MLNDAERLKAAEIEARVTAWQKHLAGIPQVSRYLSSDEWRRDYHDWCDDAEALVELNLNDAAALLGIIRRLTDAEDE